MQTIFLIRHGESESSQGSRTKDPMNIMLTSQGIEQAGHIAAFLQALSLPLDLIVTSPYLRTLQTAGPTLAVFRATPRQEWAVEEFTYLSSIHQIDSTIEERRPLVDAFWQRNDPFYVDGPGSESFAQFIERVQAFRRQVENLADKTIAVFSHEQFINAVLWSVKYSPGELSPKTMRGFRDFLNQHPIRNGAIVEVRIRNQQHAWGYELITYHLDAKYNLLGSEDPTL